MGEAAGQSMGESDMDSRAVTPLLVVGILLLPFVFAWFLLRQGYGTTARLISFSWLGFAVFITLTSPRQEEAPLARKSLAVAAIPTRTAVEAPAKAPPQTVEATVAINAELPLSESEALRTNGNAKPLSPPAARMRSLYSELQSFRWEPKFHVLGFDPCCRYAVWKGKVRLLNAQTKQQLLQEIGAPASELIQLANVYRRNEGDGDTYARWLEGRLQAKFYPGQRAAGDGRVLRTSRGCVDFAKMTRAQRQMETGDIRAGEALLDEARCTELPAGETVGAPSGRRSYGFSDGSGQLIFLLVDRGSLKLWVPEDDLAFH